MSGEGRLPPGWRTATLGEATTVCRRGRPPAYEGGETMILNQKCVRDQMRLDLSHAKLTNEESKSLPDWSLLQEGDTLINSTGTGTLGRVGFVRALDQRCTADSHVSIVRPSESVHPEFLALSLHARERELVALGGGSTNQQELRPDDLQELSLVLPPLREQRRIVELLRSELELLKRPTDAVAWIRDRVSALRLSVLAELDTAEGSTRRIDEIATVFVGATPSRKEPAFWDGGTIPWVSSGEVAFCRINDTREKITEKGLGKRETRLQPPGTVLLAMIGEGKTRGQAAILDVAAAHNQNSASIRLDQEQMLPEFLYYCLMRQYSANRAFGRGGQQPALNKSLVQAIEVPCPPLGIQGELVQYVRDALAVADEYEAELSEVQRLAATSREALLHAALTGQLGTQDPTDDPVSLPAPEAAAA